MNSVCAATNCSADAVAPGRGFQSIPSTSMPTSLVTLLTALITSLGRENPPRCEDRCRRIRGRLPDARRHWVYVTHVRDAGAVLLTGVDHGLAAIAVGMADFSAIQQPASEWTQLVTSTATSRSRSRSRRWIGS